MRKVWLIVFCAASLLFACQPSAPKTEFKAVANTQDVMESLVAHMAQISGTRLRSKSTRRELTRPSLRTRRNGRRLATLHVVWRKLPRF